MEGNGMEKECGRRKKKGEQGGRKGGREGGRDLQGKMPMKGGKETLRQTVPHEDHCSRCRHA
jgi:hypothetical protein